MEIKSLFEKAVELDGQVVEAEGWVRNLRDSKSFAFIELNDGTDFRSVQVVMDENTENFEELKKLYLSSAIRVKGTLVLTPEMQQPFEIKATSIEVEGESTADYPLQPKRHTRE